MPVVFVSYSRFDETVVKALAQGLEAAHREVWFDNDLGGGEVWWVKILESIRQAEVVIFALSDNALRSKPCRAELDYAVALNRTILPIKVGPVTNFRANPLSALQTIEFREDDAYSAFEIIAAVDEAGKRLNPLPEVLPPEPQIPFAYLASLSKQIDNDQLSPQAQMDAVDELRKAYREETDPSVHSDILAILRNLKAKPWATVQTASEVDAVLAWVESRLRATTTGQASGSATGPTENPQEAERSRESAQEDERKRRAEFERNMTEAVLRQQEQSGKKADPHLGQQKGAEPPPATSPGNTWERSDEPGRRENPDPIKTFPGVSSPLGGRRARTTGPEHGQAPSFFNQQLPTQQRQPTKPQDRQTTPPSSPNAPAATVRPPASQPRPYWGWSIVGILGSFIFGFIALYFSIQVGQRFARGDVQGAQRASKYARVWGIVGLVVGVLVLLVQLANS
jgi:hypothetical protein